jgi:hypothetical protein
MDDGQRIGLGVNEEVTSVSSCLQGRPLKMKLELFCVQYAYVCWPVA